MIAALLSLLLAGQGPLQRGLCVEVFAESTHTAVEQQFVSTGFLYTPVVEKLIPLQWHWEEIETGYIQNVPTEVYDPHYWVRLKSGDRNEWLEVDEQTYYTAVPGEYFTLRAQ